MLDGALADAARKSCHRVLFGHLPITPALAEDVVEAVLAGAATNAWHTARRSAAP